MWVPQTSVSPTERPGRLCHHNTFPLFSSRAKSWRPSVAKKIRFPSLTGSATSEAPVFTVQRLFIFVRSQASTVPFARPANIRVPETSSGPEDGAAVSKTDAAFPPGVKRRAFFDAVSRMIFPAQDRGPPRMSSSAAQDHFSAPVAASKLRTVRRSKTARISPGTRKGGAESAPAVGRSQTAFPSPDSRVIRPP